VLLSHALGHLTAELEASAGVGDEVPSLAVWSNVVRCVGEDGIDERELATAARISSRLATAAATGAARRGWVTVSGSGKTRRLRLSELGRSATQVWPARLTATDERWSQHPLRAALESIVGQLPYELPHFPATYGAADPSAVGGPFVPPKGDKPSHGKDWTPVTRGTDDTVSDLPMTALLSQALMAFTIDYENRFPWPLASTATVLCHLRSEPTPLSEVPAVSGHHPIAGNGKSLLERHLIVAVTKDPDTGAKMVALTDRGAAVMQHHQQRLEAVDTEWRTRFGDATVTQLVDLLTSETKAAGRSYPDFVLAPLDKG
jgi:hypothetical protein